MFRPQYNPKTLEEFLYLNLVTDRHNLLEEYLRGHSYKPCRDIYVDIVMGIVDFENVEAANKLLENEDLPEEEKEILAEEIFLAGPNKDNMKQEILKKQRMIALENDREAPFGRILDGGVQYLQGGKLGDKELDEWIRGFELIKKSDNPFEILGVDPDQEFEDMQKEVEIRARELSRKYHPDKGGSTEVQQKINQAKKILTDEEKTMMYKEDPSRPIFTYAQTNSIANTLLEIIRNNKEEVKANTKSKHVHSAADHSHLSRTSAEKAIPLREFVEQNQHRFKKNKDNKAAGTSARPIKSCNSNVKRMMISRPMVGFTSGRPFPDKNGAVDPEYDTFDTLDQEIKTLMSLATLDDDEEGDGDEMDDATFDKMLQGL
jgi:curved DNA-binding protein CbpA